MIQKLRATLAERHHISWYIGVAAFFIVIIAAILLVISASKQISYSWQWHRVPSRFLKREVIKSDTKGAIDSITIEGKTATINVKTADGIESFTVPE